MISLWLPESSNGLFCSEVSGQTKTNHTGSTIFHRAADNALAGLFCLLSDPYQTAPCPSLLLICLPFLSCPIFFIARERQRVFFPVFRAWMHFWLAFWLPIWMLSLLGLIVLTLNSAELDLTLGMCWSGPVLFQMMWRTGTGWSQNCNDSCTSDFKLVVWPCFV